MKAAVDAALVTKVDLPTAHVTDRTTTASPQFDDVTKYQILQTWEIGGSSPQFWKGEFTHQEKVAVMQFCEVAPQPADRAFGLPPLPPECLQGGEEGYVVLVRDLGSVRFPPFVAFVVSSILFVLGLLMLHWRERDEQEAEAAEAAAAVRQRSRTRPGRGVTMRRVRLLVLSRVRRSGRARRRRDAGVRAAARQRER